MQVYSLHPQDNIFARLPHGVARIKTSTSSSSSVRDTLSLSLDTISSGYRSSYSEIARKNAIKSFIDNTSALVDQIDSFGFPMNTSFPEASVSETVLDSNTFFNSDSYGAILADYLELIDRLSSGSIFSNHLSVFNESRLSKAAMSVLSSDSSRATAFAGSGAKSGNRFLTINQLASAQTNQSVLLSSGGTPTLDEGTHFFTLTVTDSTLSSTPETYSLSIDIDKSGSNPDTNKDVLDKLARVIGNSCLSIKAFTAETERDIHSTEVENDLYEKAVYLDIKSVASGNDITFSLEDAAGGTLVDTLRLDNTISTGNENQYRFDKVSSSSSTNVISADNNRLNVSLSGISILPIVLDVQQGLAPVLENTSRLINQYNNYMNWLDHNEQFVSPDVKSSIVKEVNHISGDLSSIGLNVGPKGAVTLTDRYSVSLQNDYDKVKNVMIGKNGFFTTVKDRLTQLLQSDEQTYSIGESAFFDNRKSILDGFDLNMKKSRAVNLYA